MIVLIVGLLQFDSGKTSLALSLISEALDRGMDVGVCKPVSAFSVWYQYEYLLKSVDMGLLVGSDALRLHKTAKSNDPIELESPVVFMHAPLDPERVDWSGEQGMNVVAFRIGRNHFYVPSNLERLTNTMRGVCSVIEKFKPKAVKDVENFIFRSGELAQGCVDRIAERHEITFVESYNNASAPTWCSLNSDVVILVAPSKIALFDSERYRKAVEIIDMPPWNVPSEEVVRLIKPEVIVEFKPKENPKLLDQILSKISSKDR